MAARYRERNEGRGRHVAVRVEIAGRYMALDVVHGHEGLVVGYSQSLRKVDSDKERADKTGICGNSYRVYLVHGDACCRECLVGDRGDSLNVRSGRNLGHNASVELVRFDLRSYDIRFYIKSSVLVTDDCR